MKVTHPPIAVKVIIDLTAMAISRDPMLPTHPGAVKVIIGLRPIINLTKITLSSASLHSKKKISQALR